MHERECLYACRYLEMAKIVVNKIVNIMLLLLQYYCYVYVNILNYSVDSGLRSYRLHFNWWFCIKLNTFYFVHGIFHLKDSMYVHTSIFTRPRRAFKPKVNWPAGPLMCLDADYMFMDKYSTQDLSFAN